MKSHFKMNNLKKPTYSHHDKLHGQSESNLFSYAEIKIDNVINLLIPKYLKKVTYVNELILGFLGEDGLFFKNYITKSRAQISIGCGNRKHKIGVRIIIFHLYKNYCVMQ